MGVDKTMDAATRDELNSLRRRAYGPAADIAGDRVAVQRLAELEELALPAPPASSDGVDETGVSGLAEVPGVGEVPEVGEVLEVAEASAADDERRGRRRMPRPVTAASVTIVVFACLLVVAVFAVVGAQLTRPWTTEQSAQDAPAPIRVPVQIDPSTGTYEDLARGDVPAFPVRSEMDWVQSLGTYYGWSLWIGGATAGGEDQNCLLLTGPSGTRSRCVPAAMRADESLIISLPFARVGVEDRPPGMTDGRRVDFVWGQGGFVTVAVD